MPNTHGKSYKTLIIAVWFGKWPAYLPYFLKSISYNSTFNWLILSDNPVLDFRCKNLTFKYFTAADFRVRVERKLGLLSSISEPNKLCDFKPVYAYLFNEFLEDSDYWGYCDIDMVFGDISRFINPLLGKFDVISTYADFLSGPFCLFRNTSSVRELFKRVPEYTAILEDPRHRAFDENNSQAGVATMVLSSWNKKIKYLLGSAHPSLKPAELRYRYQWYLKKLTSAVRPPSDMTDVVFCRQRQGLLSAHFHNLLWSDRALKRQLINDWIIAFDNGRLRELRSKREIMAFHFVDAKTGTDFQIEKSTVIPDSFILTNKGIRT